MWACIVQQLFFCVNFVILIFSGYPKERFFSLRLAWEGNPFKRLWQEEQNNSHCAWSNRLLYSSELSIASRAGSGCYCVHSKPMAEIGSQGHKDKHY